MFAHAMASTKSPITESTRSIGMTIVCAPTGARQNGMTSSRAVVSSSGRPCDSAVQIVAASACADDRVAPGRSQPIRYSIPIWLSAKTSAGFRPAVPPKLTPSAGTIITGTNNSMS